MAASIPHFDCLLFVLAAGLVQTAGLEIVRTARWGSLIHHILAQWCTAVYHMIADNPGTAVVARSPVDRMVPERIADLHILRTGFGHIAGMGRTEKHRIRHSHHRAVGRIAPYLPVVVGIDRLWMAVPWIQQVLVPVHIDWLEAARSMY